MRINIYGESGGPRKSGISLTVSQRHWELCQELSEEGHGKGLVGQENSSVSKKTQAHIPSPGPHRDQARGKERCNTWSSHCGSVG